MFFFNNVFINLKYSCKIKWTYFNLKLNQKIGRDTVEQNSYLYLKLMQTIIDKNELMTQYLQSTHANSKVLNRDQQINQHYNQQYLNLYLNLIGDILNPHDYRHFKKQIRKDAKLSNPKTIQILNRMYYCYQQS